MQNNLIPSNNTQPQDAPTAPQAPNDAAVNAAALPAGAPALDGDRAPPTPTGTSHADPVRNPWLCILTNCELCSLP